MPTPRPLSVHSGRDLGPQFVENPHRMIGQDGAYSVPLGEETLWFFGDTLVGRRILGKSLWYPGGVAVGHADMSGRGDIERMINNTGLLLQGRTGRAGLKKFRYVCDEEGELRALIPLLAEENPDWDRIWCLHGCRIDDRVYLYFVKVRMLETGPFPVNFEIAGSGLSVGSVRDLVFRRVRYHDTDLLWHWPAPAFASAVLLDSGEGWVYCFGVTRDAAGIQRCCLARVRPEDIEHIERYEYLVSRKPEWSPELDGAVTIFTDVPNELSVSFNRHLSQYLAVHSLGLTGVIVGRTAANPWGPWSDAVPLWKVAAAEHRWPYPQLIYAGKEHPELSEENGRVLYLTYIEFEEYFPHLVELTLA